ncbi:glycoside hydrolase family 57 protein [Candidatus Woesearchaeota archaeon]|nr:glycoside hydrolase family 57 protein [Candidatus Woesearchaeota archaeon]
MVSVCFYFQVHQPYRLKKYSVFDIGQSHDYFDTDKNKEIMDKVANKCYLPANKMILNMIKGNTDFKVSYSFSGVFLEQCEEYNPDVLRSFQDLADTGNVEILDETYYHSLAFLYSKKEFDKQVKKHSDAIRKIFGRKPSVFRNTELIYSNELAKHIEDMGYKGIIAEGADHILDWRSPNFLYKPVTCSKIKLLLKNYKLSDDIAFRFSNKGWKEWPLTVEKYSQWLNNANGNGNCVNLFMDYETFGEHQWEDTGIFDFLRHLPFEILKNRDNNFMTPSELVKNYNTHGEIDIHNPISWADVERDLSAWRGNQMQLSALSKVYEMESEITRTRDRKLLDDWRRMQTSDHYYYMCTKFFADGDVHKYFNPYDSPYDSFIAFMNIINDFKQRIEEKKPKWSEEVMKNMKKR